MNSKLYLSMYHYTRDLKNSLYPEIRGLDQKLFEEQLSFFRENFNGVTMEDVLDATEGKKDLPENALLLTFDDGYIDNYTVALPLLQKFGFQGSFFIPAKTFKENVLLDVNKIHFILAVAEEKGNADKLVEDIFDQIDTYRNDHVLPSNEELYEIYAKANRFDGKDVVFCKRVLQTALPETIRNEIASFLFAKYVGRKEDEFARELYMNEDQILQMKQSGMFIGIHGYDHYWLGNLKEDEMKKDVDKALQAMSDFIDTDRWVMNYPYGSHNDQVIEYIASRGCRLALTTRVDVADLKKDSPYELPRLDCNDFPPKSTNYLKYL